MRVLRGVVYMLKRIGQGQNLEYATRKGIGDDAKPEARTEKERIDKYVLNHIRAAVSVNSNQDERRWRIE